MAGSDNAPAQEKAEQPYGYEENSESDDDAEEESMFFLHDVVEQGAFERLCELLPPKKANVHEEDEENQFPVMNVMAVETLLLEKDDMNCLPIHIALIYQRIECARHLLRYSEALTSAMLRLKCGDFHVPFVHLLLRVGAINSEFTTSMIKEIYGAEPDSLAELFGEDFKALLLEKINSDAKDEEGNSVFHLCAMYDLDECMNVLLTFHKREHQEHAQKDGDNETSSPKHLQQLLEKSNRVGFRPLHVAMKFHSFNVARKLVEEYRVRVNCTTSLHETPLHVAAQFNFAKGVELLLRNDANTALHDIHGISAAQVAKRCKFDAIERLFMEGQDIKTESKSKGKNTSFQTRFFFHPDSFRHLPMAYHRRGGPEPPPENPERIDTLVDPLFGILRSKEFQKDHVTWDYEIEPADIADILRVHEYNYVEKIRKSCRTLAKLVEDSTPDRFGAEEDDEADKEETNRTFVLDPDTALSLRSYEAAVRAAGAVCKAVDQVVKGDCTNAFCIVRPPGHHAGPVGKVVCANDPEGSHGFCLFNNVAVGAAYARSHYKHHGIHKIAILDFDVHHGNGTEEIIRQLVPSTAELTYQTPYGEGKQIVNQYKPWRNDNDAENVFFCSVHGYGHKDPEREHHHSQAAWFYPGSGCTEIKKSPLIWNVGLEFCRAGASASRLKWRSAFRDQILPQLRDFSPDLIFLSAGFDAHKKENVNWGYVSLLEQDYEWLVHHIKQVANTCCNGRLISVLEGGYNFHGRMVSPFARSVAAHARALIHPSQEQWDDDLIAKKAAHEQALLANYLNPVATGSNSISKKRLVNTTGGNDDDSSSQVPMARARSKRVRKEVDYIALAEELAKEEQK